MEKQLREAGALAIRNIGIIEQAYRLIDNQISDELSSLIEKIIEKNIPKEWKQKLSCADANAWSDDSSWFAPKEWSNGDDECEAQFDVWAESPVDSDDTWCLTQLCGQGEARMGFRWSGDHKLLMPKLRLPAWKSFASQQHSNRPRLSELGFQYEEAKGSWFIPLLVDSAELAEAYADREIGRVLEPAIKECLKRIQEAVPEFYAIIEEARKC